MENAINQSIVNDAMDLYKGGHINIRKFSGQGEIHTTLEDHNSIRNIIFDTSSDLNKVSNPHHSEYLATIFQLFSLKNSKKKKKRKNSSAFD